MSQPQFALSDSPKTMPEPRRTKLVVDQISKTYRVRGGRGEKPTFRNVLRNLSFEVFEGEIVSLVGESGCGKTTLLRIIQGLVRHDSGDIRIDGRVVEGPGRDRGFVFQQASLLPWRSTISNVELGLELQGLARTQRRERARQLLKLVGLEKAEHQFPHQLSGGMQQRVGLARAFAIEPEVLLMDEPFSALDAQTREVLQQELLRIQRETGKTIIFVTHDLDEAIYLSDRIVVLGANPGRVKEIIDVPLPKPRDALPVLRGHPEFQRIRMHAGALISNVTTTA